MLSLGFISLVRRPGSVLEHLANTIESELSRDRRSLKGGGQAIVERYKQLCRTVGLILIENFDVTKVAAGQLDAGSGTIPPSLEERQREIQ